VLFPQFLKGWANNFWIWRAKAPAQIAKVLLQKAGIRLCSGPRAYERPCLPQVPLEPLRHVGKRRDRRGRKQLAQFLKAFHRFTHPIPFVFAKRLALTRHAGFGLARWPMP
jgi:hypothetical protein